ncbi:MAG: hypothetical protein ACRBCL_12710 [Maritimibacter sp.]
MTQDDLVTKAIKTAADMGQSGIHRATREAELRSLMAQIRAQNLDIPKALLQAEANLPDLQDGDEDIWNNMPV